MTDLRTRAITALSGACDTDMHFWHWREANPNASPFDAYEASRKYITEQLADAVVAFVEAEIAAENEACARIFDAMVSDSRESALHAPEGFARTLINADAFAMEGYAAAIRARRENAK